jgi:hypothetical protein
MREEQSATILNYHVLLGKILARYTAANRRDDCRKPQELSYNRPLRRGALGEMTVVIVGYGGIGRNEMWDVRPRLLLPALAPITVIQRSFALVPKRKG